MSDTDRRGENDELADSPDHPATTLPAHMIALQRAAIVRAERAANGIPVEVLDPIERAKRNPRSAKAAIRAKCWDCVGAGQDPGTRQTIGSCTVTRCPLHPHRPYQPKAT